MTFNRLAVYALILAFTSAPALAQDNKRVPSPMIPAPAASSSKPPTTGVAPTSVSTKAYDVPVLRLKKALKLNFGKEDEQLFSRAF